MSEHGDEFPVDPANGTEEHHEGPPPAPPGYTNNRPFTAPEKITNVVRAVLTQPSANPTVGTLLAVIVSPLGKRLLVRPMLSLLPPLDEPDEWDAWLAILVGCALELGSDGVEVDVDVARDQARFLLGALFEESQG